MPIKSSTFVLQLNMNKRQSKGEISSTYDIKAYWCCIRICQIIVDNGLIPSLEIRPAESHLSLSFPPDQKNVYHVSSSVSKSSVLGTMLFNRPRLIYQYSNVAPRLSGQNWSLNSQKRLGYKENNTKYSSLTRKPRSNVRILIHRTWPIRKRAPQTLLYATDRIHRSNATQLLNVL